jgi:hypothetical protein
MTSFFGSGSASKACRSTSVFISTKGKDKLYFFAETFYAVQNTEKDTEKK